MMDKITIDRLTLDLPGLTPRQAREVADRVGAGLAAARPASGSFDALSIRLDAQTPAGNLPGLADAIVRALLAQIGRS
jgi:hypothetical protein